MQVTGGSLGSKKHGTCGKANANIHFTGRSGSNPSKRKSTTKKQRRQNHGTHKNKYGV